MLIPLLLKGWPTVPTVLAVGIYITVVSLTILGGVRKKTVCAMVGTAAGMALALAFGEFAQMLTRIDGLRITDVEPLLQLRQQGSQIGLRGLLMGGVIVSTLGAVMDVTMGITSAMAEVRAADPDMSAKVTMGITSAMAEVRAADPDMSAKALFRSGMNVGRDMVGTMTNTLILAFLGSSFTLILYFYTIGLSFHQLLSSAYLSVEIISSVACSVGVILTIPIMGRDMVGTMTNTLILAFLGSSFTLILYFYTIGLSFHQLLSSAYLSVEVISSVACSVGVILTSPITALLTAVVMSKQQKKTSLG